MTVNDGLDLLADFMGVKEQVEVLTNQVRVPRDMRACFSTAPASIAPHFPPELTLSELLHFAFLISFQNFVTRRLDCAHTCAPARTHACICKCARTHQCMQCMQCMPCTNAHAHAHTHTYAHRNVSRAHKHKIKISLKAAQVWALRAQATCA